jgi:hypothetical protein
MMMLDALRSVRDCGVIRANIRRRDFVEAFDEGLLDCRAVHNNCHKLDYFLSEKGKEVVRWLL